MIDWFARRAADDVRCYMVDPSDLSTVVGEIALRDGCSVSQGYYNDTRAAASIVTDEWGSYVPGSWLRIVHSVPGTGYSEPLFTGFPYSDPQDVGLSGTVATVQLKSSIYAMSLHAYEYPFTVGGGASASTALDRLCSIDGRAHRFASDFQDFRFSSTRTYDPCSTISSMCHDVCSAASSRMDVDGDGTVVFGRYVAPSLREPSMLLDAMSSRSIVVSSSISGESGSLSSPNASAVYYKDGDVEVVGSASLPSSHPRSRAHTGVTNVSVHQLQEMGEPLTKAHAQLLAESYLDVDSSFSREWTLDTLWFAARSGDVILFDKGDGVRRKCLVKNVDSDVTPKMMRHRLTLKEV